MYEGSRNSGLFATIGGWLGGAIGCPADTRFYYDNCSLFRPTAVSSQSDEEEMLAGVRSLSPIEWK